MSKNAIYQKPGYANYTNTIRDRQKTSSLSPHRTTSQRKSFMHGPSKIQELPSTQAKRNRQNQEDFTDHIPRSIHQQKTSKKSSYLNQNIKQPVLQATTSYSNNGYQNSVTNNKVQLLKQQNLYLSQQNVHLNELLLQKNKIITSLQKKLQYQIQQQVNTLQLIQRQKNKFLQDFHARDDQQRIQIQKLIIQLQHSNQQINRLNIERMDIITQKDHQIQILKTNYHQQNKHLIDNVISKKDSQLKLLDNKIYQLTQLLDKISIQLRTQKQSFKSTQQHLHNQIRKLLQQVQMINHEKKIQLSQQKIAFENIIMSINKEKEQQTANLQFKYQVQIKKLKNSLNQQLLANSNLQNLIQNHKLQHTNQIQNKLIQQTNLKHQLQQLKLFYQQKQQTELSKQKQLNHQQTQMINKYIQMKDNQYQQELRKFIIINKQNKNQIQRLYEEIEKLRLQKNNQISRLEKVNNQLKQKISELTQNNQEQSETLKIKLGQLRHSDITSLKQYYQNQLALKTQQIIDLQKAIKQNRQKLHKQLQDKVINRKHHQKQVDQLRIRISQLQIKIASIIQQNKQKIQSIGSQMQMTSMTLIHQTKQKQQYTKQSQMQKRNLQQIITKKDQQIQQLNSKLTLIKKSHYQQIIQKQQTITILHQKTQQLNDQIRRQRQFYQKQIVKKEQLKKQTKQFYQMEIQKQKQTYSRQFTEVTQKLMKQKNQLAIQVQHLTLIEKQLRQQLSLHSQHTQQRTLEKDVSHNQQKARLQYAKQNAEIALKNYYQKKLHDIQEQLNTTKQQLSQKSQDVRSLNQKNYKLQKKLQKIMESQQKMRVLQQKVMALGQQNNLVKNVAQLVGTKSRRKNI